MKLRGDCQCVSILHLTNKTWFLVLKKFPFFHLVYFLFDIAALPAHLYKGDGKAFAGICYNIGLSFHFFDDWFNFPNVWRQKQHSRLSSFFSLTMTQFQTLLKLHFFYFSLATRPHFNDVLTIQTFISTK